MNYVIFFGLYMQLSATATIVSYNNYIAHYVLVIMCIHGVDQV